MIVLQLLIQGDPSWVSRSFLQEQLATSMRRCVSESHVVGSGNSGSSVSSEASTSSSPAQDTFPSLSNGMLQQLGLDPAVNRWGNSRRTWTATSAEAPERRPMALRPVYIPARLTLSPLLYNTSCISLHSVHVIVDRDTPLLRHAFWVGWHRTKGLQPSHPHNPCGIFLRPQCSVMKV